MELTHLDQRGGMVGLVTVYHLLNQTIDVQFAGSRDGKRWWRPDRRACLPLSSLGDLGGGMIWPMHPMIQHKGRIHLYYSGCEGLHNDFHSTDPVERMKAAKFPRWPHYWEPLVLNQDSYSPVRGVLWFYGSLCRASWDAGRLWAAVTATGGSQEGTLMTRNLSAGGKPITVNVATMKEGTLTAELVKNGKPLRGFTRADCKAVAWRSPRRIAAMEGWNPMSRRQRADSLLPAARPSLWVRPVKRKQPLGIEELNAPCCKPCRREQHKRRRQSGAGGRNLARSSRLRERNPVQRTLADPRFDPYFERGSVA